MWLGSVRGGPRSKSPATGGQHSGSWFLETLMWRVLGEPWIVLCRAMSIPQKIITIVLPVRSKPGYGCLGSSNLEGSQQAVSFCFQVGWAFYWGNWADWTRERVVAHARVSVPGIRKKSGVSCFDRSLEERFTGSAILVVLRGFKVSSGIVK